MTYQRVLTKEQARNALRRKHPMLRAAFFLFLCLSFSLISALPAFFGRIFFPTDFSLSALLTALTDKTAPLPALPSLPYLLCRGLSLFLTVSGGSILAYGACAYCLDLWRGRYPDRGTFFAGFAQLSSVLALGWLIALFSALWALLGALIAFAVIELPAFLLTGDLLFLAVQTETPNLLQNLLSVLEKIIFYLFLFSRVIRYALAFFTLSDQPRFSARRCLKESKMLMAQRLGLLVELLLSFLGWLLPEAALLLGFSPLRAALNALFPASLLPGVAFWLLRILLILYLAILTAAAILLPLWLLSYMDTALAGFYDFAQSDARNRPAPPRSWQVYG